jgi:hypothetical protein
MKRTTPLEVGGSSPRPRRLPMKAVVVYESMYGNTHLVAEAVRG